MSLWKTVPTQAITKGRDLFYGLIPFLHQRIYTSHSENHTLREGQTLQRLIDKRPRKIVTTFRAGTTVVQVGHISILWWKLGFAIHLSGDSAFWCW